MVKNEHVLTFHLTIYEATALIIFPTTVNNSMPGEEPQLASAHHRA